MKQYKKALSLITAAALTVAAPAQVLAENPHFAHDEATWARLRDNIMEYDELQMLVEEYNPIYMNNQASFIDTKEDEDAEKVRQNLRENAMDAYDRADDLRSQAEDYLDMGDTNPAMVSFYASYIASAITVENSALKTAQSADSSYSDSEMKRLKHIQDQAALVRQAQGLFATYNQLRKTMAALETSMALQEALNRSIETKAQVGMATQVDILTSKKNLQSMQSTYTQSQASLESIRQQLCLMTGWKYNDQPEIREVPPVNLARIDLMNPEMDKLMALANNYQLKYNRRAYENMQEKSTDKKNMERTIKNQEETIKAEIQNLYNDVLQKKTALELAEAELATASTKMNAMEVKRQLGTASQLEYLQEQSTFAAKQIDRETAEMNLFQAMESYDWALIGFMS